MRTEPTRRPTPPIPTSPPRPAPAPALRVVALALAAALALAPAPLRAQGGEAAPGDAPLPSVELPPELDRVLRDYERLWEAGDAEGLAALFTPGGHVRADPGWVRGRDRIADRYTIAGGDLQLRAIDWATDGDTGWIVGAYGYAVGDPPVDGGSFLLALRRGEDGRWLIAADLDHPIRRGGG